MPAWWSGRARLVLRAVRRRPLGLAVALALLAGALSPLAACSSSGKPRASSSSSRDGKRWVVDKPARGRARRHASHEHAHGEHPHGAGGHHHHPHPHPHLEGQGGHHHPY